MKGSNGPEPVEQRFISDATRAEILQTGKALDLFTGEELTEADLA